MKAIHIFCHNAVLLKDKKGRMCIATGKGIGFMKKEGDRINQRLIQNVFIEDQNYLDKRKI